MLILFKFLFIFVMNINYRLWPCFRVDTETAILTDELKDPV